MSIWVVFKLIGSLALLMFGMKSMSESLQKMAGPQLRRVLGAMTTNRFTGMLTGVTVTAAVQSSTATTLMTVSFVNAGLLTLMQAISVIMGANIGTTVTAWIMSLGFSFNITDFVYPAFFIGIILIYMKKRRVIGDFLFGVALLFLGLGTLKETGTAFATDEATRASITAFFSQFDASFWSSMLFLVIGSILTLCVQSSAAMMAITCSSAFASNLLYWAAEVQVDHIRSCLFHNLCRFHHRLYIATIDLYAHRTLCVADGELRDGGFHVAYQGLGTHELCIDHCGAESLAQQSESDIRHVLHGCQKYGAIAKINASYLHFGCKFKKNP